MIALPLLFAHRCGGASAPENTLAGLRAAVAAGCRAVEFDVMLTADGTPVLIHDETLERTTNGSGEVSRTPDRVLFALDAGSGEPIPSLAQAAEFCIRHGLLANVEIKPARGYEQATGEVVARFVAAHWRGQTPLLSSFSAEALAAAQRVAPQLLYGQLFEEVPEDWLARHRVLGAQTLHCDHARLRRDVLAEAAAAGVPVLCYTVNDADRARALLASGVAAVFSDRLDLLA